MTDLMTMRPMALAQRLLQDEDDRNALFEYRTRRFLGERFTPKDLQREHRIFRRTLEVEQWRRARHEAAING